MSGCSVGAPYTWGVRGPIFEPHVPAIPESAVVYVYVYLPGPEDIRTGVPDPAEPVQRGIILPSEFGRTPLLFFLNGQRAAPFYYGGYSVLEVQPGEVEIAIRYPPGTEVDFPALADRLPEISFSVEANSNYYVWARQTYVRNSRSSGPSNLMLLEVNPNDAMRHLRTLRKQDTYL
jgi:hypothetical protein